MLSIVLETYHYYVYLSYTRRGEGALNQLEIIDLCFDLPSRKFDENSYFLQNIVDYTRNLSLLCLFILQKEKR